MAYVQVHWSPLCRVWLRGNIKVAFWLTLKGWPCEVVTGCFSASHFLEKLQIDTKEVSGGFGRSIYVLVASLCELEFFSFLVEIKENQSGAYIFCVILFQPQTMTLSCHRDDWMNGPFLSDGAEKKWKPIRSSCWPLRGLGEPCFKCICRLSACRGGGWVWTESRCQLDGRDISSFTP